MPGQQLAWVCALSHYTLLLWALSSAGWQNLTKKRPVSRIFPQATSQGAACLPLHVLDLALAWPCCMKTARMQGLQTVLHCF